MAPSEEKQSRLKRFWDWVDDRDIDKHVASWIIFSGTVQIVQWAMHFANTADRPGIEVAAIVAAVCGPYMALQAAALKWYFNVRST